jgi:hypothetical protein
LGLLAELTRAIAAAHRYEDLRYRRARHEGIAPEQIPGQILDEFYSAPEAVEARSPGRHQPDAPEPRGRPAKALP